LAKLVARTPYGLRFGPVYGETAKLAEKIDSAPILEIKSWAFPRLKRIVDRSFRECTAYRTFYQRRGYHPDKLATMEHFQDVPIVTKADLQEFTVEERSLPSAGKMLVNTGGTSGAPLAFHVDGDAFAREWAHMHLIWGRVGYHYRDVMMTMTGRNLGDELVRYNPVHNEWIVNTYADRASLCRALSNLLRKEKVKWIQGYPSIVAELVSTLSKYDSATLASLGSGVRGVLFASEYPTPQYTEIVKRGLNVPTLSWYGHSEMCILAYQDRSDRYIPLHSYGLVEAVPDGADDERLIGTSYWNTASPFIRYDAGDRISSLKEGELLRSFAITAGRVGDFVVDRNGARISLTSLIIGRHHEAFGKIRHVQVRQQSPGVIELLIVPQVEGVSGEELMHGFDFSSVQIEAVPVFISEPVRTAAGKIKLLVN